MVAARQQKTIDFDGAQIFLLQDLSRHTLALRKAEKPLLEVLRERYFYTHGDFLFIS